MPRDSQLWSYSNPGVRKELQSRGENIRPMQPDKDVDSAFNFLETYSIKEDGAEPPMEADSVKSYSKYLSSQQERQTESQGIPRYGEQNKGTVQKPHDSVLTPLPPVTLCDVTAICDVLVDPSTFNNDK